VTRILSFACSLPVWLLKAARPCQTKILRQTWQFSTPARSAMVNAASIAQPFLHDIAAEAATLSAKLGRQPKLLGILANADEPSRLYAKSTCKACTEAGLDFELLTLGSEEEPAQPSDVEASIIQANLDDSVDGIMTYMPLFGPSEDAYLQQVCAPQKDIEGLHFFFRFLMYHVGLRFMYCDKLSRAQNVRFIEPSLLEKGTPSLEAAKGQPNGLQADWPGLIKAILPCTSLAVVKVLEGCGVYNQVLEFGKRAFGKTITVINRCGRLL
jgi:methylenetetrahydrofolate dehydrogenase (NAD+)